MTASQVAAMPPPVAAQLNQEQVRGRFSRGLSPCGLFATPRSLTSSMHVIII